MNTTNQMRDDLAGARESITSGELFTGDDLAVRDGANSRRESEMELDQFEGHTPGPLACVELMAFAAGFAVEDGEGRTVARIMKTHGVERLPSRANAALFAAAPELLAEVRRLTAEADALRRERDELTAEVERMRDELKGLLHAAQAKAVAGGEAIATLASEVEGLSRDRDELAARLAKIERAEPVAWIERITGRLAAPTDEHRTRFPMVYRPLIDRPVPG